MEIDRGHTRKNSRSKALKQTKQYGNKNGCNAVAANPRALKQTKQYGNMV